MKKIIQKTFISVLFTGMMFPATAQITITKQDATCDLANGSATASVNHGTPPYKFTWSNGKKGPSVNKLKKGTYTVVVVDSMGCTGSKSVEIKGLGELQVSLGGGGTIPYCIQDGPPEITLSPSVSGGIPPVVISPTPPLVVSSSGKYTFTAKDSAGCKGKVSVQLLFVPILCSRDPNEIFGPAGYGEEKFISARNPASYIVNFENDPAFATAPAQKVIVTYAVDPHMNLSSLRLQDFGFGNLVFSVPPNTSNYSARLDVRDSLGVYVDVTAGINVGNNTAFWIFQSIDPLTGLPPEDPLLGFLPVNDTVNHHGEGFISFSIRPRAAVETGDSLRAGASIVFDINPPLATNTWLNIADAVSPSSSVNPLPASIDSTSVIITVSGSDDAGGSGIASYELYAAENAGPYLKYGESRWGQSIVFNGNPCNAYSFFSIAIDNAGNTEAMKTASETMTLLSPAPTFMTQPASLEIPLGNDAVFSLTASNAAFYQWESSNDGGFTFQLLSEQFPFSGVATSSLVVSSVTPDLNGLQFRCLVSNGGCYSFSDTANLLIISTLSGTLKYDNDLKSPLSNTTILLKNLAGLPVDSTITNLSGSFIFSTVEPGEYIASPVITVPWGGVNATDALHLLRYFANLESFSLLRQKAGDVNLSGSINAIDALLVAKRFVALVNSFVSGDWVQINDTVDLGTTTQFRNYVSLCYGDVDGTYIPGLRTQAGVSIVPGQEMTIQSNQEFSVSLSPVKDIVAAAISLVLDYPSDYFKLEGLSMKTRSMTEEMLYSDYNGQLRIAWYNLIPVSIDREEPLITLSFKALNRPLDGNLDITAAASSEVCDRDGKVYENLQLLIPKLVSAEQPSDYTLGQNYPNPFRQNTEITFFLPDDAVCELNIFNSTGQLVNTLINGFQSAGFHKLVVDASKLSPGIYPYRLEIKNSNSNLRLFHIMTISN